MTELAPPHSTHPGEFRKRGGRLLPTGVMTRAILIAAVILTFWHACRYDFVNLDDEETVTQNPLMNPPTIRSLKIWWTSPQFQLYDPLTATVRAGIVLLARTPPNPETGDSLNPKVFHSVNILLHIGVTLLVYQLLLCCQIKPWPACGGALVFAIHPLQVEPVVWITSIKDLLYGTFGLLALWRLLVSMNAAPNLPPPGAPDRKTNRSGLWNYLVATLAFILAMLSKPTAVILPVVALPLIWACYRRIPLQARSRLVIWAILAIPLAIAAKYSQPAVYAQKFPVWERFLVAGDAVAFYLAKVLWPQTLLLYYGRTPAYILHHGYVWWTWIVPAALIGFLWLNRQRYPRAFAGLCIFIAGLFPVLGFVTFNFQYYSTVADRYLYVPMFGIALIAAGAIERFPRALGVMAPVVLAVLAGRSALQIPFWHDSLTLFGHVLDNDPTSAVAYADFAAELGAQRDYEHSVELARRSIALDPNRCEAYDTLGKSLARLGRTDDAVQAFRAGFGADQATGKLLNEFVSALLRQGNWQQAIVFGRLSVELTPTGNAFANLGTALARTKEWQSARHALETAVTLEPENYNAQYNLATVLLHLGDRTGAVAHYQLAKTIDPSRTAAREALERMSRDTTQPAASQP